MTKTIRIATRPSPLAMTQANIIASMIRRRRPDAEVELVEVASHGDLDRTSPAAQLTETGAFVRSIQHAVLEGRADLAVHSCKDLPVEGPGGLVKFFPARESARDVLCGSDATRLPYEARVGTGSTRRAAQLLAIRSDIRAVDVRGNIETRLAKVESGELDAVVLAEAGLLRLGLEGAIDHRFTIDEMVPAPGQGTLCVEAPEGTEAAVLASEIDDPTVRLAAETERMLMEATASGCRDALGAHATVDDSGVSMEVFHVGSRGPMRFRVEGRLPSEAVDAAVRRMR